MPPADQQGRASDPGDVPLGRQRGVAPGEALASLAAVEALEKGRSDARDRPPIAPVAESVVLATLAALSPQVAAMVRLQLLTAARPGEVCSIRPRDVDRSDPSAGSTGPSRTRPSTTAANG